MHELVNISKLKLEYVGNTKGVSFYEYIDSKERFNKIRNGQIKFDDSLKKQKFFFEKNKWSKNR